MGRSEAFRTLAHELALQIAATSLEFVLETDIPESVIERETRIATTKAKAEGKPDAILPRIIEGAIKKYKNEFVLMLQPYIRDESITAGADQPECCAWIWQHRRPLLYPLALGETTAEETESDLQRPAFGLVFFITTRRQYAATQVSQDSFKDWR